MIVKRLLRCTLVPVALCGLLLLPGTGRAGFVLITDTSGLTTEMLFNSAAQHDVHSFVGSVGAQSGGIPVTVTAGQAMDVTVNTGAGFATIKPSSSSPSPLTSVTFTPTDDTLFNDWVTNGQLDGPTGGLAVTFSISVTDQNGVTTTFNNLQAQTDSNGNYPFDIGVLGTSGSTIKSVTFSADNVIGGVEYGIKESKQTEFSFAPGVTPTPEPSTMALALSGLVGAGLAGLRRLRRRQAASV
jgi:hypothetical protein